MSVILASTYHDPEGRLMPQIERLLSLLLYIFEGIAISATPRSTETALAFLRSAGVRVEMQPSGQDWQKIGAARRHVVDLALRSGADHVLHCDFDRVLHWAEFYPDELREVARQVIHADFTVLGRTPRAFASHPRIQRDTEAIINHVFGVVSGLQWDVTAAARGISQTAAQAILAGDPNEEISVDTSWTLFMQGRGDFSMAYHETEGLEFETADRYADEITAAGGLDQWMAQLDSDPRLWAHRLELARLEVEAMLPYLKKR